MIVSAAPEGAPRPDLAVVKGLRRRDALEAHVRDVVERYGGAFVQTDMRAHMNPTRKRAIARASEDLVRRLRSPCPHCGHPDFSMRKAFGGRPCQVCRSETLLPRYRRYKCLKCGHYWDDEDASPADAAHCPDCNP
jgi:DNA-directed RNA polymerase subunit RPC12/RpoP